MRPAAGAAIPVAPAFARETGCCHGMGGSLHVGDISVGARNLVDEEPPSLLRYNAAGQLITGTVSDIDRPGYDALGGANIQGRILYLSFTHAF